MRHFFQKIRRVLLDGLFPAYCLGCKAEGEFLCAGCFKTLPRLQTQTCPLCYTPSESGRMCDTCRNGPCAGSEGVFLDGLLAGSQFEEHSLLQRSIHQLKYDFVEELSEPLGLFLYETFRGLVLKAPEDTFVFCPLPLHPNRWRWRGFNQAELLCSAVVRHARKAGFFNVFLADLLERIHFSTPQMELSREERIVNVRNAFRLRTGGSAEGNVAGRYSGATLLLVDDIATTLSTLNSAAAPLKEAGFERVYGLVLARVF